jgi:hypothetical protein
MRLSQIPGAGNLWEKLYNDIVSIFENLRIFGKFE